MHAFQSQLYADHYNFLRLLRFLEAEISCYESGSTHQARLPVILDIFDYIQAYPERWHHPIEDAVFELLLIKQVPHSDIVWGLKSEHKKLEELTHKASQLFSSVANDTVVPVNELLNTTKEFILRQIDHINTENKIAYPLLEKYISDAEWEQVGEKVQRKRDPLFSEENQVKEIGSVGINENQTVNQAFDHTLKKEYQNLYKIIMQTDRLKSSAATARAIKSVQAN